LESLQFSPASPTAGELKDQGVAVLLREIALSNKGLCVVTTRYAISDLRNYWQTTAPTKDLLRLSTSNGVKLLRSVGVTTGSNAEFEQLVEEVDGHALTLQIMGGFLARAFHGDVRYRDRIRFEKADKEIQGGHAYRAINAYVKWMKDGSAESRRELAILQVLGLFDRAATEDCLRAIFAAPIISGLTEPLVGMSNEDMELSITSLQRAKLVTVIRTSAGGLQVLDAHPIIKDFFACQLRDGPLYLSAFQKLIKRIFYSASSTRSAWIKAHRRIYKHLCSVTKESEKPSLEEILPLYQAIFHGCHAGLQQEACDAVYFGRILRERENYSTRKLGAFSSNIGAIACFFVRQWNFVSSALVEKDQNWILNEAATCLRALGRLTEAIDPYEIGLKNRVLQKQWIDAAGIANNLSELVLCLGATDKAIEVANSSVSYASTSKDVMRQIICKTTFADSLHQAGRLKEADDNFVSAEQLLIAHYHRYRFLAATMGFQYGELLLGGAECVVWKIVQDGASMSVGPEYGPACQSVVRRAKWSLQIAQGNRNPLDTAFDNLTLGRAMMYDMIIYHNKLSISRKVFAKGTAKAATIMSVISTAEDGFRLSGIITEMPRVLVTRALLRYLSGQLDGPDSSQRDLDEAVEIAQRGPMPMFMADIHLYRARLFFREEHYPWDKNPDGTTRGPKDDLIEARRLIEKHGYWRRKEELEDAERAIIMKK
jgi:tetratricopeptide (TPR) repeat protein